VRRTLVDNGLPGLHHQNADGLTPEQGLQTPPHRFFAEFLLSLQRQNTWAREHLGQQLHPGYRPSRPAHITKP
jgi:hypothetical protein